MGMVAILVMWPGPFEQTIVPPPQGGSKWNLASIGPVVSEEMFENVDNTYTHIRMTEAYLYYKLTYRLRWAKHPKDSRKNCCNLNHAAKFLVVRISWILQYLAHG